MTYPYVQAAFDYGARKGPALAFVVHMAEGGGTVGYLSRTPDRGVSVHYVLEYTGRIVQMLHEDRASGSINPNDLRTSDDADGFFGATVRKAVMGSWDHDPNAAVISLEIEGYATAGPNLAQQRALPVLVNDVRSRHPDIGLLGHRDFQDYKACPGRRIDWPALGGHGSHTATEKAMPSLATYTPGYTITVKPTANVRFDAKVSAAIRRVVSTAETWAITGSVKGDVDPDTGSDVWYVRWAAATWEFTAKGNVTSGPTAPVSDCTSAVTAATTPLNTKIADLTTKLAAAKGTDYETARAAAIKGAGDAIDALPR